MAAALPRFIATVRALQLRFAIEWPRTALFGFSQGAIMALEAAQAEPELAGRVIAFSGRYATLPALAAASLPASAASPRLPSAPAAASRLPTEPLKPSLGLLPSEPPTPSLGQLPSEPPRPAMGLLPSEPPAELAPASALSPATVLASQVTAPPVPSCLPMTLDPSAATSAHGNPVRLRPESSVKNE